MRMVVRILSATLAILIFFAARVQAADISSGSGVVIGANGEVLTNAHVVSGCAQIAVRFSSGDLVAARLVALDEKNDLAVIRSRAPLSSIAAFSDGRPIRPGDAVIALGYPLPGLLTTAANLTVGNVSALAGLGDDSRFLQISAPVQPGNSGGPLLDMSGHVIGIVTSKLDAARVAQSIGDIPQNVNFALKSEVVRTFLGSKSIPYQIARSEQQLSPANVGDIGRPFTVQIECERADTQRADTTTTPPSAPPVAEMQRPIDALFVAWRRLDLQGYLGQWAPGAIKLDLKSGQRSTLGQLAQDRARLFGQLAAVDADYAATFKGFRAGIAEFDVSYGLKFRYRSGREFAERACESYKVRSEGSRWLIIENQDYKRC